MAVCAPAHARASLKRSRQCSAAQHVREAGVARALRAPALRAPPLCMAAGIYEEDTSISYRLVRGFGVFFRWLFGALQRREAAPLQAPLQASTPDPYTVRPRARGRGKAHRGDLLQDEQGGPDMDDEPPENSPFFSKLIIWAFTRLIYRRAIRVEGLDIQVQAASNRKALSGNLQTVCLKFQTLALPVMQITGGAAIRITGVDLKMLLFLQRKLQAFKKPFEVSGSYVFTNNDFVASPVVRNMVQSILSAARTGVTVTRVSLQRSMVMIHGVGPVGKFKVATELAIARDGHVVKLRSMSASQDTVWIADPFKFKVGLPADTVSCDMGDNTRIDELYVKDSALHLKGRFVISPFPPLQVADVGKRGMVRYDVAEKLSTLFSELLENSVVLPNWSSFRFW